MKTPRYHITATAEDHFWTALGESRQKWGARRTEKYRLDFLKGLNNLAKNHRTLVASFRQNMTQGTDFRVHLLEHRYVVFQDHDQHNIIIAGIFHEKMDIPSRVRELAMMTQGEIEAIRIRIIKSG